MTLAARQVQVQVYRLQKRMLTQLRVEADPTSGPERLKAADAYLLISGPLDGGNFCRRHSCSGPGAQLCCSLQWFHTVGETPTHTWSSGKLHTPVAHIQLTYDTTQHTTGAVKICRMRRVTCRRRGGVSTALWGTKVWTKTPSRRHFEAKDAISGVLIGCRITKSLMLKGESSILQYAINPEDRLFSKSCHVNPVPSSFLGV